MKTFQQVIFTVCFVFSLFSVVSSSAQAPQAIPFQAVARDTSGNLIINQNISLRFSIRESSTAGIVSYKETQSATTNELGMFTVNIGQGTPVTGTFSGINWGTNTKFIQVELDASGGSSYTDMGTQQMLSVPYALHAGKSAGILDSLVLRDSTGIVRMVMNPNTGMLKMMNHDTVWYSIRVGSPPATTEQWSGTTKKETSTASDGSRVEKLTKDGTVIETKVITDDGNGTFTVVTKKYYPDGTVQDERTEKSGKENGIDHKEFDSTGTLRFHHEYTLDSSTFRHYYPDGTIQRFAYSTAKRDSSVSYDSTGQAMIYHVYNSNGQGMSRYFPEYLKTEVKPEGVVVSGEEGATWVAEDQLKIFVDPETPDPDTTFTIRVTTNGMGAMEYVTGTDTTGIGIDNGTIVIGTPNLVLQKDTSKITLDVSTNAPKLELLGYDSIDDLFRPFNLRWDTTITLVHVTAEDPETGNIARVTWDPSEERVIIPSDLELEGGLRVDTIRSISGSDTTGIYLGTSRMILKYDSLNVFVPKVRFKDSSSEVEVDVSDNTPQIGIYGWDSTLNVYRPFVFEWDTTLNAFHATAKDTINDKVARVTWDLDDEKIVIPSDLEIQKGLRTDTIRPITGTTTTFPKAVAVLDTVRSYGNYTKKLKVFDDQSKIETDVSTHAPELGIFGWDSTLNVYRPFTFNWDTTLNAFHATAKDTINDKEARVTWDLDDEKIVIPSDLELQKGLRTDTIRSITGSDTTGIFLGPSRLAFKYDTVHVFAPKVRFTDKMSKVDVDVATNVPKLELFAWDSTPGVYKPFTMSWDTTLTNFEMSAEDPVSGNSSGFTIDPTTEVVYVNGSALSLDGKEDNTIFLIADTNRITKIELRQTEPVRIASLNFDPESNTFNIHVSDSSLNPKPLGLTFDPIGDVLYGSAEQILWRINYKNDSASTIAITPKLNAPSIEIDRWNPAGPTHESTFSLFPDTTDGSWIQSIYDVPSDNTVGFDFDAAGQTINVLANDVHLGDTGIATVKWSVTDDIPSLVMKMWATDTSTSAPIVVDWYAQPDKQGLTYNLTAKDSPAGNTSTIIFDAPNERVVIPSALETSGGLKTDTINSLTGTTTTFPNSVEIDDGLVVTGPVTIADGTQAAGEVLTSDANGNATWQPPATPASVCFLAKQNGNIVVPPAGVVNIPYNTEIFDDANGTPANNFNSATGVFTVPVSGKYQFNASVGWIGITTANPTVILEMIVNGMPAAGISVQNSVRQGQNENQHASVDLKLNAGDLVQVRASHNSGMNQQVMGMPQFTVFSGHLYH